MTAGGYPDPIAARDVSRACHGRRAVQYARLRRVHWWALTTWRSISWTRAIAAARRSPQTTLSLSIWQPHARWMCWPTIATPTGRWCRRRWRSSPARRSARSRWTLRRVRSPIVPNADFSGLDKFVYQVRDDDGLISNAATVRVLVSDLGRPPMAESAEQSGRERGRNRVSCRCPAGDQRTQRRPPGQLPVPPPANQLPPPLLDVTGDNVLSPRDALWIINYLCRQWVGRGRVTRAG